MNKISNLAQMGLAHKAFGNPIPQQAYSLIEDTEKAVMEFNPHFSAFDKLRDLMGDVCNGTNIVISFSQDEVMPDYFVSASLNGEELWSERGISLMMAINNAHKKHKVK